MRTVVQSKKLKFDLVISSLIPLLLFWIVLIFRIPNSVTFPFSTYLFGLFVIILLFFYLFMRLQGAVSVLAVFGLTMLLFALALSYKWTSGFSDNFMIGGLLPYKDAKNYYVGAHLILQGLPLERAGQATERPLFPGFLSSLLLLTGQNLKASLAIMVQLAGIGLYLSARQINRAFGAFPASLYMTLMYFYIQPLLGYTLSEILGFMLGCFAFVLIWHGSHNSRWSDLILGLMTLLVAVSARAGAFLIFPMLVLWVGWRFRGEKHFSLRTAAAVLIGILAGYYLLNGIYARLLGVPPGSAFGNFSYALYGQVRGGTGWHSAMEELGTRDPDLVYHAALQFFLAHPLSLIIGLAKSYRDFFLMGNRSVFAFGGYGWSNWLSILLWGGILLLLIQGLLHLAREFRSKRSSLLLAAFVGIFLSIPFLPPIDGGARFHASTMPFFFIIPAAGLSQLTRRNLEQNSASQNDLYRERIAPRFASIILMSLVLVLPILTYSLNQKATYTLPSCRAEQAPFAMEVHPGSYINLVKDGTAPCGFVPEVCLSDLERNNTEKSTDDFYQALLHFAENNGNLHVVPAIDLVEDRFHYFFISYDKTPDELSSGLMTGCAVEALTQNQSIYKVESILSEVE